MRASLTKLTTGLAALRRYIATLDRESDLLAVPIDETAPTQAERLILQLRGSTTLSVDKRRFNYNTLVVSAYGYFEQFVEEITRASVEQISAIVPDYGKLPQSMINQHIDLSIAILSKIDQRRYRAVATQQALIANLHGCLQGAQPYKVNAIAFSQHASNMRLGIVQELATRIGAQTILQRIRDSAACKPFMKKFFTDRKPTTVEPPEAFGLIDDLAERRNDVAHGVASEILHTDIFLDYVETIEAFSTGLYQVLCEELIPLRVLHSAVSIGKPIRLFAPRICGVRLDGPDIQKGDSIILKSEGTGKYKEAVVQSLGVGSNQFERVAGSPAVEVALKLSVSVKATHELFLVRRA